VKQQVNGIETDRAVRVNQTGRIAGIHAGKNGAVIADCAVVPVVDD